jgi:hypothetical protein
MPTKNLLLVCVVVLISMPLACSYFKPKAKADRPPPVAPSPPVPAEVLGTMAEYAVVVSGGELTVDGYGLVVGLGKNGSSECPPAIEGYLIEYLKKNGMGSPLAGTGYLQPKTIIRDLDTAVVAVRGEIPPGAAKGARFDLTVTCPPVTQTRNLDGGLLMPTELKRATGSEPIIVPGRTGGKVMATSGGAVFLNPFLDIGKPSDKGKLRAGRIIGGGVSLEARAVIVQLYQPDHGRLRRLRDRINERFPVGPGGVEAAKGIGNQIIELTVPAAYRDDIDHFTQLVMHLPMVGTGGQVEQHALRVGAMMEGATLRHEDLAMILEAMGQPAEGVLRSLYTSANPIAAYFAARTGLRLGDAVAVDAMLKHASSSSKYQIQAIEELGRRREVYRAGALLRSLLDDENNMVRLAAYEALLRRNDPTISSLNMDNDFTIDIVPSTRDFMIYARQSGHARIALFGKRMPVTCPMFYNAPDDLLTVNARAGDKQLTMFRKVPRTGQLSSRFYCDFLIVDMITLWGKRAEMGVDQQVQGMGLTYGQIVGSLSRMCKEGDIPARFVLQEMPDVRKISEGSTGAGRPDLSE